jgi:YD repeat-containing protein
LTTEYVYDVSNRLTSETVNGPQTKVTKYFYDSYGNLTAQIEGFGGNNPATTQYSYDEFNQKTLIQTPRAGTQNFYYDAAGTITQEEMCQNGQIVNATRYVYSNDGWLVTKCVANDRTPASSVSNWTTTAYGYDQYGRRTSVIDDVGHKNLTTSYAYNNQSEVTRVTQPGNMAQVTVRDGRGLVSQQINERVYNSTTKATTTSFQYDANGNLTRKTDGSGASVVYKYDGFDRQTRVQKGS